MEVLGIDFGGSGIKGAPVNIETGELTQERHRIPTPKPSEPKAVAQVIKEIAKHFNWKGKIGIGFPAVIQNGIVKTAANIDSSWIDFPANEYLTSTLNCPAYAINDADSAGLAEVNFGAGKEKKGLTLLLTVGTGIGSVLFINGHLVPNTEFGHINFKDTTIEKYAADSARKKLNLSWKKWGKRFNEALQYYEFLIHPDLIILGGGTSKKMEKFNDQISIQTPLVPAELRNEAGIIGAAIYASMQD